VTGPNGVETGRAEAGRLRLRHARHRVRPGRPRVVVLGGGFAGIAAVRRLAKADVDVTLVDQHPYGTFQPLLYQVATAGLNPGDVVYPLRSLTVRTGTHMVRGRAVSLDTSARRLRLADGRTVEYDYLLVAGGATTNYFGIPGAAEYALPLYTRADAIKARDRVFGALETAAAAQPPPEELRLIVVGGGATGVEMAGALAELRHVGPQTYPELDDVRESIVLIELGPDLLAPFKPRLRHYARSQLLKRGVEVRTDTAVTEVLPDGVVLKSGERLSAVAVIWAAGVTTDNVLDDWGLPRGRGGRIRVGEDLQVVGIESVFAAGDIAIAADGPPLPQVAQPAIQGGRHAAEQILAKITGVPTVPFHYRDKGTMATIGRRSAVTEVAHLPAITGTIAWLMWVGLHLVTLLGGRNRASALVNLVARYTAWPHTMNVIVGDADLDAPKAITD
jgi:NADH:quinone reductase (non-electrogenic)